MSNPFLPVASLEEVLRFDPNDADTWTRSPLVNAVAEALYATKFIECKDIAHYLALDERKLSNALCIELGVSLKEVLAKYRVKQILHYMEQHEEINADEMAQAIGYASASSLSKFMCAQLGITTQGKTAHRSKDRGVLILSKIRELQREHLLPEEFERRLKEIR